MAGSRGDRQARDGPRAFSAGNDLAIRAAQRAGQNDVRAATSVVPFAGITRDFDAGKVIVAAINGYCLAGGLELALACDLRVVGTDAAFGFSEVTRGLAPGAGGTQRLPRIIGIGPAVEMITTGATLTRRGRLAADLSRSCRLRTS